MKFDNEIQSYGFYDDRGINPNINTIMITVLTVAAALIESIDNNTEMIARLVDNQ